MSVKKRERVGKVRGKVLCLGGGRYCINEPAPRVPSWLSSVMLSDFIGMTCRRARAFDNYTRKELKRDSKIAARALMACGVQPGDCVIILDNYYPGICMVYAAMRIGAIAIPFSESVSDETLANLIKSRDCNSVLVANDKTAKYAENFCALTNNKCKCVFSINTEKLKETNPDIRAKYHDYRNLGLLARFCKKRLKIPWSTGQTIMIGSSSGTSGEAKLFPYVDKHIIFSALSSRAASRMPLFKKGEETWLSVVPLQRPYGIITSTLVPSWGRRRIRFVHPEDTIDDLYKESDVISCAPDFLDITEAELTISGYDLTSGGNEKPITLIIGGAHLTPYRIEQFRSFMHVHGFRPKICYGYGTSESSGCISVAVGGEYRPDTIGRLCPGVKVWLRKEDGSPYRLGETGQLWVAGDGVINTYDNSALNDDHICYDDNGEVWVDTGDYVSLQQSGYLIFRHSEKDFYFTDTHEKIFPAKAEELINNMEGVKKCWVLGDKERCISAAFITPMDGIDGQELIKNIQQTILHAKTKNQEFLTSAEVPNYYEIVELDEIKENDAGKRDKKTKDYLFNKIFGEN